MSVDGAVPEQVISWTRPSGKPDFGEQVRLWSRANGSLGLALLTAFVLLVLDSGEVGAFWQAHPFAANMTSGIVTALILLFGLDRFVAARNRRQLRPFGLMVVHEIDCATVIDEQFSASILEYCSRTFGSYDPPAEVSYPELLDAALSDLETWEAPDDEVPAMLEQIVNQKQELEEKFTRWVPLMVVDPSLAAIAAGIPPLLNRLTGIIWAIEELHPSMDGGVWFGRRPRRVVLTEALAADMHEYWEESTRLVSKIEIYRAGRPMRRRVLSGVAV